MIKSTNSNSTLPILVNRKNMFWLALTTIIVGLFFILKLFDAQNDEINLSKKIIGEKYINPLSEFQAGFSIVTGEQLREIGYANQKSYLGVCTKYNVSIEMCEVIRKALQNQY
jgi:hypothetical protein